MQTKKSHRSIICAAVLALALTAAAANAATTDCATDWNNFQNNPGYIAEYTTGGQGISDNETSSDPSNGGTGVEPDAIDLASGSPNGDPGPYTTPFFGYYNGGTVYDPDDPTTMEDDYIFFRMRLEGDPRQKAAFTSRHWNVLLDVDDDGYKEYWIDLDGTLTQGNTAPDRLQILYDNSNRQDITDPDAVRVDLFTAFHTPDGNPSCTGGSPGLSHTRVYETGDGVVDYYIEIQVPMVAFDDLNGNQVLFPDSPVAFVFSTSTSNVDPLQKDFMSDLNFLSLSDPITFGDVVIPNGRPQIQFLDANGEPADFYVLGDDVFVQVTDRAANTDPNVSECITVTVTNPATGDDESVTLCETGSSSGIFTNFGGACNEEITTPNPAPVPPTAWIAGGIITSTATVTEDWTLTYASGSGTWTVTGSVSGLQTATVTPGTPYTSDGGQISFTLYQDAPTNGTVLSFCTRGADPLSTSTTAGVDDDGDLQGFSGDQIAVSYTNPNGITITDNAILLDVCDAFIQFTRATGLPADDFELGNTVATSDKLYVTVFYAGANTNPAVAETIQVTLTGNDTQTLTLTETGVDTGEFRNTTGLDTKIDDGVVTAEDGLWEDVDGGVVTATYSYTCMGSPQTASTTADLFYIGAGGRVRFTNGAATQDIEVYGADQPIFIEVRDPNACTTPIGGIATVTVTVTSPTGDSETLTLYETAPGSGKFMNRRGDLVTTASSAVVTSASSTFVTDGVMAGDTFVIATGPDTGSYTVASVDSQTQIALTTTLTSTRTNIAFNASPLLAATSDGAVTANDGFLEADHDDTLTVSYTDCNDGDADATNDVKTDTARYNAPPLLLNAVLFEPDASTACQTEAVEIINTSSSAVTATGYMVSDGDAWSYTVPQLGGTDIILQPGERIFLSIYPAPGPPDFFDTSTYYLFNVQGTTFPTNVLEGNSDASSADQVSLFNSSGVIQDYIGWSATLGPPLDFLSDDSPAVLRSIWQDDAFRNVSTLVTGEPIARSPSGFDRNLPGDWQIASADLTDCTFITTRADVTAFDAFDVSGRVVVRWETASEVGTVGFFVERLEPRSGLYHRVGAELVPAVLAHQGGVYHLADDNAGGAELTYRLVEVESGPRRSREIVHGPFTVPVRTPPADLAFDPAGPDFQARAWPAPAAERARAAAHREARDTAHGRRLTRVGTRIKVTVRDEGLTRLDAAEIATLFDLPQKTIEAWIRGRRLELSNRGASVAWTPTSDGSGILFWGEAIDSTYTEDNVYVLEKGNGTEMATLDAAPRSAVAPPTFTSGVRFEEETTPAVALASEPEDDFWFWAFLVGDSPTSGRWSVPFELAGVAGGSGHLAVALHGGSSSRVPDEHQVEALLNGVSVGEVKSQGLEPFVLDAVVPPGLLLEGGNVLELVGRRGPGAAYSVVLVDAFEVAYERFYEAHGDLLEGTAASAAAVAVDGFTSPDVTVLDLTDPRRPRRLTDVLVEASGTGYRASFEPPALGSRFVAAAPDGLAEPLEVAADVPSSLASPSNMAELVVIAPAELSDGAQRIAEHRRAQGMSVLVADLEDVMDEYHHSILHPEAIGDFLADALRTWAGPPRFALLVGAGNIDYKDRMGLGANPMPPALTVTGAGLFVADNRLGDVDGDGVPEVAMGRLPVLTTAEVDAYLAKVEAFEGSAGTSWRERVALVADDNPGGPDSFARDSESMATFLVPGTGERLYLGRIGAAAVRQGLLDAFRDGVGWVNHVGHGGLDRITDEAVLKKADVPGLGNASSPPIFTAFSCLINRFGLPGFPSLGADLTAETTGGAVAVFAPSALSIDDEAAILGQGFFRAMAESADRRLGSLVLQAMAEYAQRGHTIEILEVYTLLGDPTLEVR